MKNLIFLVDELTPNNEYGMCYSDETVSHNLKILGEEFLISSEIQGMISVKNSISTVVPIGRYATIIVFNKDHSYGLMFFICHKRIIANDNFKNHLIKELGEDVTNEWFRIHGLMTGNFNEEDDNVELSLK